MKVLFWLLRSSACLPSARRDHGWQLMGVEVNDSFASRAKMEALLEALLRGCPGLFYCVAGLR